MKRLHEAWARLRKQWERLYSKGIAGQPGAVPA